MASPFARYLVVFLLVLSFVEGAIWVSSQGDVVRIIFALILAAFGIHCVRSEGSRS